MSRISRSSDTVSPALTTASVPIRSAVAVLQRAPEPELPYPYFMRVADTWHGFRDRRRVTKHRPTTADPRTSQPDPGFATDFLARLASECLTRQETERRTTRVAIAVLDDTVVTARHNQLMLESRLPDIDRRIAEEASAEISDDATTSAERYDTPLQRRVRRLRDHRARMTALHAERKQAVDGIDAARQQIDTALEARRAHWDQLLVRTELLCAHYNRRSRTYARSASRRTGRLISTHHQIITEPEWSTPHALPQPPAA